jgi:hypothetical protein
MNTEYSGPSGRYAAQLVVGALAVVLAAPGCGKEEAEEPKLTPTPRPVGLVDFPAELRAADPSVNDFLYEAFQTCASGNYEAFRLLWSVREDPISEQEFIRGWQTDPRVSIKDLKKMRTPEGAIVYAVRALVEFDPGAVPEPNRDIVFVLVKENEEWRIAGAPRSLAKTMKGDAQPDADAERPTDTAPATQPTGSSP